MANDEKSTVRKQVARALLMLVLFVLGSGAIVGALAWASGGGHSHEHSKGRDSEAAESGWICPMTSAHPLVYSRPGLCPLCGMTMVKTTATKGTGHMAHMSAVREWLHDELGDSYDEVIPPPSPAQLERGRQVFLKSCTVCHGATGRGDGPAAAGLPSPPADFTDPAHSRYYSDRGRLHIIRVGVPGTPMVGWAKALADADVLAVHDYIRSLRKDAEAGAGSHSHGSHEH